MHKRIYPAFIAITMVSTLALAACSAAAPKADKGYHASNFSFDRQSLPIVDNQSGSYLAGRFAQRQKDWHAAQNYLNSVLTYDDSDNTLRQRTFLLSIGANNHDKARDLAKKILKDDPEDSMSLIFLTCDALSRDDFAGAMAHLDHLSSEGFGQYTKPLLTTWAMAGMGKKDEALEFLSSHTDDADPTYRMHAGLIEEFSGDMEAAAEHYKVAMSSGLTMHSAVLVADFFIRHGQPKVAEMIYSGLGEMYPFNPFVSAIVHGDRSQHGAAASISRPAEGAGFALFDLATLLFEKQAYDSAQIYGGMMQLLVPGSPFGLLMMGDLAAMNKHYGPAVDNYGRIGESSPLFWLSRMRIAEAYEANGRVEDAVALLTNLSEYKPTRVNALVSIGDIQRRHENFAGALEAYDTALNEIGTLTETHWPIIYARGMALERLNLWQRAEKDLLQALHFQPDNPMILNFIGYSWVDKGMHMDKALEYIRRAIKLRPEDGYILDSYGWALYRTGRYEEAVEWMERAVQYVPDDVTILDHLGDAYWQMGRDNEARFKWRRADELSTDDSFKTVIQNKMRSGIQRTPAMQVVQKEAKL